MDNWDRSVMGNYSAVGNPVVADTGAPVSDVGASYGDVNLGQPKARTAMDDAMLNVMLQQMQSPVGAAGPRIVLDDFGNPVAGCVFR